MAIEIVTTGGNLTEVNNAIRDGFRVVGYSQRDQYSTWALVKAPAE